MQIHHFDPTTFLYAGSSEATPDPMELQRTRATAVAAAMGQAHAAYAHALGEGADLQTAADQLHQALAQAEAAGEAVEPTSWLIPANATDVAPPEAGPDQQVRWADDEWILESIPEPEPEPEPEPPTPEQLAAPILAEREKRISRTQWLVDRHRDELEIEDYGWTSLPTADYQALLTYRQELRDVTEQADFPGAVAWPVPPAIPGLE